jgi:hypothetical protein
MHRLSKKILDKYDAMAIHGMVQNKNSSFLENTHHKGQFISSASFIYVDTGTV